MAELLHISHPFLSAEDLSRRVGSKSARQIRRLRGKYPQLAPGCGTGGMLLALSVAWGMTEAARNGNHSMIQHIDAALTPYQRLGYIVEPPGGCITVGEKPYYFVEGEQDGMMGFLWDGFAIFIENEPQGSIAQPFFDLAERHQRKAYSVIGEDCRETHETDIHQPPGKDNKDNNNNNNNNPHDNAPLNSLLQRLERVERQQEEIIGLLYTIKEKGTESMGDIVYHIQGNLVQGDLVQGDKVMGDKVMGDKRAGGSRQEDGEPEEPAVQTADFCLLEPSPAVPGVFATEKARRVMQGLQETGLLDGSLQPVGLSWAEKGYLAQQIAYKLGITHQWKVFGELWHCDNETLRNGYNRAKEMEKMADFDKKIKKIIV